MFYRLSLLLASLTLYSAFPQTSQAATNWIYYNGLSSWSDSSYGSTPNYKSTAGTPLSGAYDIAIADVTWGAWQAIAPAGFSLSAYGSVTFSLQPTVAHQTWKVALMNASGVNGQALNVANYGPTPVVGKWGTYTIPLSAFAPTGPSIYSLVIQDESALAKNLWYADNIGFVPGSGTTPTVTFSANPTTVASSASATLTWSALNATVCQASGGWSGAQSLSGTKSVTPTSTTTYSLYCTGPAGAARASATVTVKSPAPTVTLTANPAGVTTGVKSTLTWASTNATSCTASGAWSGSEATSGSLAVTPSATSTYSLSCTGAGGSAQASATVTVTTAPRPTVTLSANPASITAGASSTLTWASTNATSCTASGAWSGSEATSGSLAVTPSANSTYTLACTGVGGSSQTSVIVNVTAPATLPDWVYVNGSSTVSADWSFGISGVNYSSTAGAPLSGIYDIEVDTKQWGAWQPSFGSLNLAPYSNFTIAIKPTVANQAFNLAFTVAGASSAAAVVNPLNYGPAPVVGQWGVYTIPLSALGVSGQSIQSFALQDQAALAANTFYLDNVGFLPPGATAANVPPTVTISSNPLVVAPGGSSTLTWASTNSTACVASSGWSGTLAATNGSKSVSPAATNGYTITCSSPWGSAAATTGVTVTKPGSFAVQTAGGHFVDANGNVIQLRGVNIAGLVFTAVSGYDPQDPTGGSFGQPNGPNWTALQAWKPNTVRIPLNEASWLGLTCTDTGNVTRNADPGNNYKQFAISEVTQAVQLGMYVVVDLHWAAPGASCPMLQTQMADADHSLDFWTSIANTFKNNPAVMFELYNEPFLDEDFTGDTWQYMMFGTGGSFSGYPAYGYTNIWKNILTPWNVASYQTMINTVRATGATNPILIGSVSYTADLSGWLSHKPYDPLNQLAATWHPYPAFGTTWGTPAYAQPNYAPQVFAEVKAIQASGVPVIATETGDHNAAGTVGAPLVQTITQFADANGVSVLGWTWNVFGDNDFVLIKDANGTPTDGYGVFFQNWLVTHQ